MSKDKEEHNRVKEEKSNNFGYPITFTFLGIFHSYVKDSNVRLMPSKYDK